ncbi:MAG: type VI secretion system protein, partial [Chthoniobacteraceae bacterium]
APFAPDRVTDHLATVVQRIKKRRLSLLRDPVPQKGEERRTDEVDALYSLPQSIQLLAPRLRQYLEKIFVAGPWSPKPLFLRGIYFTSSMREGAALDQELAQALGLSADQLSEAKVWEKERAYFLRDIFTEKVFRERGLVTRATDTKKMLRKRGLLLWGTASLLAFTFVGFTFYSYQQFADSIKRHSDLWAAAKNQDDWKDARWKPIVQPDKPGDTVMRFHGAEPPVAVGERRLPLLTYQDQLRDVATKPVETGWVYRPMLKAANLDQDRLKAQRIVYEASVVYPLIQGARYRMQNEAVANAIDAGEGGDSRLEREARALAGLLRIESDKVSIAGKIDDLPDVVMLPLLQYITASKAPADEEKLKQLRAGFTTTYTANPTATWVPERLAIGSSTLVQNAPIQAGLGRLRALAGENVQTQLESAAKIARMRDDLRKFREIETEMDSTASGPGETKQKDEKLTTLLAQLATVKSGFDAKFKAATADKLITGEKISMVSAYQQVVSSSQSRSTANFQLLRDAVKPHLAHPTAKLFKQVDDELEKTLKNLAEQVQQTFNEKEREELTQLDTYLDNFGDHRRIYEVRFATYQEAADVAFKTDKFDDLIGKSWAPYSTVLKEIDGIRGQLPKIQLKVSNPAAKDSPSVVETCNALLKIAEERRLGAISTAYLAQTLAKLEGVFFEPLVSEAGRRMTAAERKEADLLIDKWKLDLASPDFQKVEPTAKTKLTLLLSDFEAMKAAGIAYDQYVEQFKKLSVRIVLTSPGDYKWHIVEGGGRSANIFKGESFSITVPYSGGGVTIRLRDPVNGRSTSGSLDTRRPGVHSIGGLPFNVQLDGEIPRPPPPGPKKSSVTGKLR